MRVMKICGRAGDHSGEEWGENQVKCRPDSIALLVHVLCLTAESELCCAGVTTFVVQLGMEQLIKYWYPLH